MTQKKIKLSKSIVCLKPQKTKPGPNKQTLQSF